MAVRGRPATTSTRTPLSRAVSGPGPLTPGASTATSADSRRPTSDATARRGQAPANATPQDTPHCLADAPGLYRTASRAPGSGRGAGAATEPPISVSRPGPERGRADRRGGTAVDTRSTSRTQSAESTRWVVAPNKKRRADTGGAARRKIAGHELGAPFHDQNTRGRSEKQSGDPALSRRVPPLPDYPPGLSGTMGSTSPAAAAETAAARRHPSGQDRAATAQSTAALAPAPAPRSGHRRWTVTATS